MAVPSSEAMLVLILLLGALAWSAHGGRPHINNLNVLLPPKTLVPVRYRLQGSDGCFVWTWDHHDIISLEAEYNGTSTDCSTSAIISVLAPFEERQSTAVHARDLLTGEVLRCEVFIDKIFRIQIFHHSVKLDLDGWATLKIRAFDAEDNVFSSLVGLRFIWQLSPVDSAGASRERLLHVNLKDSPWIDSEQLGTQIHLEEIGYGSDLYVVRGVSAGQEVVKARLVEPNMEELEDTLVLTVAEAISIEPHSPLYIIPGTSFRFRLRAMRQNILTEVSLPSPHHQWFTTNSEVARVDRENALLLASAVGATNIIVEDVRVKGHQQMATVHVVNPSALELYLSPIPVKEPGARMQLDGQPSGPPWFIVSGKDYVVHVRAFSLESGSRSIYLTNSNDLHLFFNNLPYWEAFEVPEDLASDYGWQNATLLKALGEGSGSLVAKLVFGEEPDLKVVKLEQPVTVCSPVRISSESEVFHLPWSPSLSQEYQLGAEGGCGEKLSDYSWSSSNPYVVSVNALGKLQSRGPGQAKIKASSAKDPLNVDEIQVDVSVPASMVAVPGMPVEVEVQTILPVAVSLTSPSGLSYSRCDAYNTLVQWDLLGGDENFRFLETTGPLTLAEISSFLPRPSQQTICAWNSLQPVQPGRTTVAASLKVPGVEAPGLLEDSWTVASYAPLALNQVSDGSSCGGYSCKPGSSTSSPCQKLRELLLAVGSGVKVALTGGPERWRQGSSFIEFHEVSSLETGEKSLDSVLVTRSADGGGRMFFVSCVRLGNYELVFHRGYQESEGSISIVASVSLSVVCGVPSSIVLIIDEPDNNPAEIKAATQLERDETRRRLVPVTVVNDRSIRVAAAAVDSSGRAFANASSLTLTWELNKCLELLYWQENSPEGGWERSLTLRNTVGQCGVRATFATLKQANLPASTITSAAMLLKQASLMLTDAAQLQLVAALRLEPRETLLFAHSDAKVTLQVLGGTKDIESHVNDTKVAVIVHPPASTRSSNIVVAARSKGTSLVSIMDIGLASPASATALVHVADIAWIKLTPDDITLELGSTADIQLQVGDSSGRVFDPSQFVLFKIRVHFQDKNIGLVNETSNSVSGNSFFIRGEDLGFGSFYVTAQQASGRELQSDTAKFEVYAPIFIQPSPLVLAPGAQFLLAVHGGPRTGIVVEFSSSNTQVATVDSVSGLVFARAIGNEAIVAKAHDHAGRFLGETFTELTVSVPVSMFLAVRGGLLGVEREMSIFPVSNEGNLFAFFEMCSGYEWRVSDEEMVQLLSVKPDSGSRKPRPEESTGESRWHVDTGFSARVVGRSPGRASVSMSFACQFHGFSAPRSYSASESISVVPDPPLSLGMRATWLLPPHHKSLKALPQRAFDRLSSNSRAITYSLLHDEGSSGDVFSIEDGHIKTGDRVEVNCIHSRDRVSGRSEIAVCIRVAEVFQMTVGDNTFPFHVAELSVGTQHSFTVTLRDNIGTPFNEVNLEALPLSIDTNRADLISVKATRVESAGASSVVTVVVQASREGHALIRVSQKSKVDVDDYILVFVGAYVQPRNPVMHIGDRINFSIAGKAGVSSLERGHWFSENDHVVHVNSRTGEALALSEGTTVVSFNGSRLTAYTPVTVASVEVVTVQAPKLQFLTNVPAPDGGHKFIVKFRNRQGGDVGLVGDNRAVKYDCKVSPSFIGRASPWHDTSSGTFYCIFFPHPPETLAFQMHRELESRLSVSDTGDSKGMLQMTMTAFILRRPEVAGWASASFAAGFSIINKPRELQLSSLSNRSRISVVGNVGALAVSWTRKDALNVRPSTKTEELGVGGHAMYEVFLLEEDKSFTDKLVFLLKTTGQREEISMWYDAGSFYVAAMSQQIMTVAAITLVVVVLPLFLCTKLLDLPRPFSRRNPWHTRMPVVDLVNQPGGSPGGLLLNGPAGQTPSGSPGQFGSPRSPPKPYTEYVSRTIEQTPYFSRQGIRRYDPSRTY